MKPVFRFTLDGVKQISAPIGWKDITSNLDRDMTFHSLVENIDVPLEFYGRTSTRDGGYQYLKEARNNGIDTQIEFLVEISFDRGQTYEDYYLGIIDLTTLTEIEHKKKFQATILQDSLWAKFINRKAVPVDIQSATSIDGTSITVVTPKTQSLPSQQIRRNYFGTHSDDITYVFTGVQYGIIDWKLETLDEINTKNNYPRILSSTLPFEMFAMEYAGDYLFECDIYLSTGVGSIGQGDDWVSADISVNIQINDDAAIAFSRSDDGTTVNVDRRTHFDYSATHSLNKGDLVRIYIANAAGAETVVWLDFYTNTLSVQGDTTFPDSTAQSFAIHDVASSIADRIIGQDNSFYSAYFGGTTETSRVYSSDGDGLDHSLLKGIHIRGYTVSEKPFSLSFDDWWEGANNIFNLGLGYDEVGGAQVIRVEQKTYFYEDAPIVTLIGVNNIEISFDTELIHTSIKIGYQEWEAESASGIDDPQTQHAYSTRFKTVGSKDSKDVSLLSTFYAASLGIEQTRREVVLAGKDWRLDENVIILESDLGVSTTSPVLYTSPTYTISGLINPDTRYNVRLTPATNFYRWKSFLNIGLHGYFGYGSDFFKFQRGEGNIDLSFTDTGGATDLPATVVEDQDWQVENDNLFTNVLFKFTHPLTWTQYKEIRNYRTKSIRIQYVGNDGGVYVVTMFIKKLSYKVSQAKAEFQGWIKTIADIAGGGDYSDDYSDDYFN